MECGVILFQTMYLYGSLHAPLARERGVGFTVHNGGIKEMEIGLHGNALYTCCVHVKV